MFSTIAVVLILVVLMQKFWLLLIVMWISTAQTEEILTLHGSNTVGADLAPRLAGDYLEKLGAVHIEKVMKSNANEMVITGYFNTQSSKSISIHAHGSSTGFKGLIGQAADIAMSSRPIKHEENLMLMGLWGDLTTPVNEHVIALDGLAIVTHESNVVKSLTLSELAAVFSGEINNWKQLGGLDLAINLYARDDVSGTYDTFKSLVLKSHKKKLSQDAKRFESNSQLVEQVMQDQGGIGFTGLAYAPDQVLVKIAAAKGLPEIKPDIFSVASEDYPLARRLFLYGNTEKNSNPHVAKFIEFAKTLSSQKVVANVGFVAQQISESQLILNDDAPEAYRQLAQQANRLSTTFRLRAERATIDTKSMQDIKRLVAYFEKLSPKKIILVGFSADESGPERNQKRAYIRSKLLAYELRQYGFRNVEIISMGSQLPIDSNQSAQGRFKNNRTEIWVSRS
ncbi:substrate-binding domain-containing protein [Marinicella rhabdoformis]|uniref:substrate-binding domain-containing protein n=1 Tax=Marinicella rhabdoformis TaxID=2580566 RepID=UPI0012AEC175|nr:substrate-binding domain-containing protein [Marinicella rhabdoformis]